MKTILIALLGIVLLSNTINTSEYGKKDCSIMHEGQFSYFVGKEEVEVKIDGLKHIEYHDEGKYVIESVIIWINDCEYNMTMTKVTIPNFPYGAGDVMNVKINKVKGMKIYYTSTVNGNSWDGVFIKRK